MMAVPAWYIPIQIVTYDFEYRGSNGDDWFTQRSNGSDAYWGYGGNDIFWGSLGNDSYFGGYGFDTVSYNHSNSAIHIDLKSGSNSGGHAEGDTLVSIEQIIGSRFNDSFVGDNGANRFSGGRGNDEFMADLGADTYHGGSGTDTVNYARATYSVQVYLSDGVAADWSAQSGVADGDRFISIENVIGSRFNDTIVGDAKDNVIRGLDGRDTLEGLGGNDHLFGGRGMDFLKGGDGKDRLEGGDDRDRLEGGNGNDALFGGRGDDLLFDGRGSDVLTGGMGADVFSFDIFNTRTPFSQDNYGGFNPNDPAPIDTVTDYDSKEGDRLDFGISLGSDFDELLSQSGRAYMYQSGDDVMIEMYSQSMGSKEFAPNIGAGVVLDRLPVGTVVLQDMDISDLSADDFIFG